jgi:lipopolysaccharide transport system permease protein
MLLMLAQGLSWILAGLHVFVRDTIQVLQILIFLWFWFTPILYSTNQLPENLRFLATFNPMALIVTGYRNSVLNVAQPSPLEVLVVFAASLGVLALGAALFKHTKPAFPDVL